MKPQILATVGFFTAVAIAYSFGMNASFEAEIPAANFLQIGIIFRTANLWVIATFTILLCQIHIFSSPIRHWMRRSGDAGEEKYLHLEVITSSLGSGMAIAYVFLQLLPQLNHDHPVLSAINPYLILAGFLAFYGMERLATQLNPSCLYPEWELRKQSAISKILFSLELTFLCGYNALIVYTVPDLLASSLTTSLVYLLAMILHLLKSDHSLGAKYPKQFRVWGRYTLTLTTIMGAVIRCFFPPNFLISDTLLAILALCTLLTVFKDELPDHIGSSYRWFLGGASFLGLLMFFIPYYS